MKNIRWTFAALLFLSYGTLALAQTPNSGQRLTSSKVIDYFVTLEEARLVAVADAMPQDKYPFSPTSGEFKGVRTFAQQLKHAAADNYMLGAAILGEKPPADVGDETGPDSLRTKADVVQYVKHSFAYLHRAVATIDDNNMVIGSPRSRQCQRARRHASVSPWKFCSTPSIIAGRWWNTWEWMA
jgi:hypothetical protein